VAETCCTPVLGADSDLPCGFALILFTARLDQKSVAIGLDGVGSEEDVATACGSVSACVYDDTT
jgi:hypothetical protein